MNFIHITPITIIAFIVILLCVIALLMISGNSRKLDRIKAKEVGDGQHGNDRFMTDAEAKDFYTVIKLPEKIEDHTGEFPQGRIINYNEKTREAYIDTTNTHARIVAPTESGKSTEFVIPNVQYNIMAGTSQIIPDTKKEIYEMTAQDARNCGFETYVIDFQDPELSVQIDLFEDINEYMDHYLKHGDIKSKAACEDAAGALAMDIVYSRDRGNNENPFFALASKGVIHSLILLLSMFAEPKYKHLGSISNIIHGMLEAPKDKTDKTPMILKIMRKLPDDFGAKKYLGAAFAAAEETETNIYSSVLGDLEPYINALAEQIIAKPGQSGKKFSYRDLLDKKSILYIVIPEHKPQFRSYASIIIRKLYNQLTEYANSLPGKKLPRRILLEWEEFALYPKVNEVEDWMAIMRGRGIIGDFIYQTDHQLKNKYGEDIMKIMMDQCAVSIYLALSQEDTDTAERLSKAIGTKTIKTGSVSISHDSGKNGALFGSTSHSETEQMMEQALMRVPEILHMDQDGIKLLLRRNQYPFKTHLCRYYLPEWGLQPATCRKEELINEMSHIEYMTYDQLMYVIDEYMEQRRPVRTGKETVYDDKGPGKLEGLGIVADTFYKLTGDRHCAELVLDKKYGELFPYMDRYKKIISKYELQQLLEPYAE